MQGQRGVIAGQVVDIESENIEKIILVKRRTFGIYSYP